VTVVFFGSSEFSLSALRACFDFQQVSFVITTPPQKKGRGLIESPTPVYEWAVKKGLPVEAPANLKDPEFRARVEALKPDFFVVSSYGKMIPSAWLKIPRLALNIHPSLLPKYRGAAPMTWPILNGDTETGLSIAEVTDKLDAGDIFYQSRMPLDPRIDAQELSSLLAEKSYEALKIVFKEIAENLLKRIPQTDSDSCYARKLTKEDGFIDWNKSAVELSNQIRGLVPWPIAQTFYQKEPLQILKAHSEEAAPGVFKAGQMISIHKEGWIKIQTGKGALNLELVKPAGKKQMSAADFARGKRLEPGAFFENPPTKQGPA